MHAYRSFFDPGKSLGRQPSLGLHFRFETTLGGETITELLEKAIAEDAIVKIWYVGLDTVERHIVRVRERVRQGGHDIPEERIRERYVNSRLNLIRLLPGLSELRVYDNSAEADPDLPSWPDPKPIIHLTKSRLRVLCPMRDVPEWARAIVAAAIKLGRKVTQPSK